MKRSPTIRKPQEGASYRTDVASVLSRLLSKLPGVRPGKVFTARPAFFVGTKLFAFVYRDGVVLKLPEEKVRKFEGPIKNRAVPDARLAQDEGVDRDPARRRRSL